MPNSIDGVITATEAIHRGEPVVVVLILALAGMVWGFIRIIRHLLERISKLEAEREALLQLNADRLERAEGRLYAISEKLHGRHTPAPERLP